MTHFGSKNMINQQKIFLKVFGIGLSQLVGPNDKQEPTKFLINRLTCDIDCIIVNVIHRNDILLYRKNDIYVNYLSFTSKIKRLIYLKKIYLDM